MIVPVTVFPVPTFLLLNVHALVLPVTVSPLKIALLAIVTVQLAVVFPFYVLLLALNVTLVAAILNGFIVAVVVALVLDNV